eukprot:scaffold275137_cov30-Prasinocladus_malaysianus.AAC.1
MPLVGCSIAQLYTIIVHHQRQRRAGTRQPEVLVAQAKAPMPLRAGRDVEASPTKPRSTMLLY